MTRGPISTTSNPISLASSSTTSFAWRSSPQIKRSALCESNTELSSVLAPIALKALTTLVELANLAIFSATEVSCRANPFRSGVRGLVGSISILPDKFPELSIVSSTEVQGMARTITSPNAAASLISPTLKF